MCGICGIVTTENKERISGSLIGAMCDVITHRGPDEEGIFIDGGVALGMRRLKIIDLSTGSQPIFNEDRSVAVVFNGEIYNFIELQEYLLKKGHKFYTKTDTEVIVHLYEDYGEDFLRYLNGMFGIALWDKNLEKLILARDRMGEKPLYYTHIGKSLIFGSELKSILCYPKLVKRIEKQAVYHYFTFNYIPSPLTIYKNVYKLFPGEYLIYKGNFVSKKKYWDVRFNEIPCSLENEIEERLLHELTKSVKMRLISDVPIGAFLSGGIDSSIIVALMSCINNKPVKTFSIGLEDDKNSELPFARAIADKYGTEHYELIAKPDALNLIDRIVWHFDEPFGDSSAIPTFLVSQLTRKFVTVAISGDGGDELFGGYTRYQRIRDRSNMWNKPLMLFKPFLKYFGDIMPYGFKGKAFLQGLKYDDYSFFAIGTNEEFKNHLFADSFLLQVNDISSVDIAKRFLLEDQPLLNKCMFFDMKVYLPDDILTKVDRMGMANSLEIRPPFLDHNLVEFAFSIKPELKVNEKGTKYILKKTFKNYLPQITMVRHKSGFSIPLEEWYRKELKPFIMDILSKKRIKEMGMFNNRFISKLITQHMSGKRNHKRLLWMILMFQLWYESWFIKTHPRLKSILETRGCG